MGIPGFFAFLKKYNNSGNSSNRNHGSCANLDNNFIKTSIVKQNEIYNDFNYHLFLDFNGAIYTAYYTKNIKTESALIIHTIAYLDTLVSIYTSDTQKLKTLYIALDGVPPRAKMEQQRMRRFHSVKEKHLNKEIEKQWGANDTTQDTTQESDKLDTTIITPGTTFMMKLKTAIEKHLKENEKYKNIENIIFSSASVPGEGEHKIFKYLKDKDEQNYYSENDNIIVYGLDADLIMLSMIAHINNIYLLREKSHFGTYLFDIDGYES